MMIPIPIGQLSGVENPEANKMDEAKNILLISSEWSNDSVFASLIGIYF